MREKAVENLHHIAIIAYSYIFLDILYSFTLAVQHSFHYSSRPSKLGRYEFFTADQRISLSRIFLSAALHDPVLNLLYKVLIFTEFPACLLSSATLFQCIVLIRAQAHLIKVLNLFIPR